MVTMLEPWTNGQRQYVGLSTDEKPTAADGVRNGDLFIEMDTGVWYLFNGSTGEWTSDSSSGGGDSGGDTDITYANVRFLNRSTTGVYHVKLYDEDDVETEYTVPAADPGGETLGELRVKLHLVNGVYRIYFDYFSAVSQAEAPELEGAVEMIDSGFRVTGNCAITMTGATIN